MDKCWEHKIQRIQTDWSFKVQPNLKGFKVICNYSYRIRYLILCQNSLITTYQSSKTSSQNVISSL